MAITQAITEAKEVTRKDGVQLKREYNRFVKAHNRFLHETFDNLTYSDKDSFLVRNGVKVDGKILELAGRINASYRI
ncbi:MAG: hypothetical protein NT051_06335, partial [Candidatus Micrarchaeota archaeon]|nr:hypothetical protein [Candidatus Micrarchaeota archaeon]